MQKKTTVELSPSLVRLRSYGVWMLGRQDYTENKLRMKMKMRFPESADAIEGVLQSLIDDDSLNDKRFIKRLVSSYIESGQLGPSAMTSKLYQKGFNKADIQSSMSLDIVQEHNFFDKALIFKIKHYGEAPIIDQNEKRRALGKLVRKGFSFSDSLKAISTHSDDIE